MQDTNKAKISMSLVGRQRGERSSHSLLPRPSEEVQLAEMSRSHQDKSSGHWAPFLERSPGVEFGKPSIPWDCDCEQFWPGKWALTGLLRGSPQMVRVKCLAHRQRFPIPRKGIQAANGWGKGSHSLEVVSELQVLVEQVAEVRDREGMHPVVVGWVPVALLHHQTEPGGGERAAEGPQALLRAALQALPFPSPFLSSWSQCLGAASHSWSLPTPPRLSLP